MKHQQKGFTLVELITVVIIIMIIGLVFGAGVYGTIIKGNFWYTEAGVLRELQLNHPRVEKILKSTRNNWDYSEFLVHKEDDTRATYYLDTDVFWNYEFHNSQDD